MITLAQTTCKRFDLWHRTVKSFFSNCTDIYMISDWLIVDDSSDPADIVRMYKACEKYFLPVRIITRRNRGHWLSLNILLDAVKTEYAFMLEDDWDMVIGGAVIGECLHTMECDEKILSVLCRHWDSAKDAGGYFIHGWNGKPYDKMNICTYPGYSLNPSLQKIQEIKKQIGYFRLEPYVEFEYAKRYASAGYLQGMTAQEHFKHTGGDKSAYKVNGTKR